MRGVETVGSGRSEAPQLIHVEAFPEAAAPHMLQNTLGAGDWGLAEIVIGKAIYPQRVQASMAQSGH